MNLLLGFLGMMPLGLSRALGKGMAYLLMWGKSRSWLVTLRNLELCYPQMPASERRALALKSLQETACMMFEVFAVWRKRDWQDMAPWVKAIEGEELFKAAVADQRGLILLVPHIGNWEAFATYLADHTPYVALFKPSGNEVMDSFIKNSRTIEGSQLQPTNRKGVMAVMKQLMAGGTTAVLPDQVPEPGSGEFAPFFGLPAYTMTLVHKLQKKTHAQILLVASHRVPGGFKYVIQSPDPGVYAEDEGEALAGMNRSIENLVALAPAQFQWEYKRFRRQPDDHNYYQFPKGWFKKLRNRLRGK